MLITQREKRTMLYILPLIALLAVLLYVLAYKAVVLKSSVGCIICHPAKFYSNPHPPYAKIQCLSCHSTHGNNGKSKSVLKQKLPNLCLQCHQPVAQKVNDKIVHKPFQKGKCMTCHSPHGSNYAYMLVDQPGYLCRSCHYLTKYTPRKDQHKPYENGWCIVCHTGHSSNIQARLWDPQKVLCLGCHQPIATDTTKPSQMKPFVEGKCTGCHNPHASNNDKQLQKPLVELCISCHEVIKKQLLLPSAHPVLKRKLIVCTNCHVPHGSWYAKLLQRPFDKTAAGCGVCHLPHGSINQYLLKTKTSKNDVSSICLQCHLKSTYDTKSTHPVRNKLDTNAKTQLSCISTCHKSLYWPNMSTYKNEICVTCHTGHNSPLAGIGSETARKTMLLRTSITNIRNMRWEVLHDSKAIIEAPRVNIQVPPGKTKVKTNVLSADAQKLIGNYHRLPAKDQFKIRKDGGCMLCHNVVKLP